MPRDSVIPIYDIAAPLASSWPDLPLSWHQLLRDSLTALDLPPDPDLFPAMSLRDLCFMASVW
jgi:hypothetical protein